MAKLLEFLGKLMIFMTEENGKLVGWQLRDPASHLMQFGLNTYPIQRENGCVYVEISGVRYRADRVTDPEEVLGKYELVKQ